MIRFEFVANYFYYFDHLQAGMIFIYFIIIISLSFLYKIALIVNEIVRITIVEIYAYCA